MSKEGRRGGVFDVDVEKLKLNLEIGRIDVSKHTMNLTTDSDGDTMRFQNSIRNESLQTIDNIRDSLD